MKYIEQIKLNTTLIFIITTIFLIFIYFPAINIPFIQHDDYRFWHPFDNMDFIKLYYMSLGRYLASAIMYLYDIYIVTFHDLTMLRFITVLAVSLSISMTVRYLYYLGLDTLTALFFGISIFLVPAMQIGTFWLIVSESIYAVIPSLAAGILLVRYGPLDFREIRKSTFCLFVVFLLLFVGIVTYPASATIFFVPILMLILYNRLMEWKSTRVKVVISMGMFFVSGLLYFIMHKFIVLPKLLAMGYPQPWTQDTFSITFELVSKIDRFIKKATPLAFNLWNVYTSDIVFMIVFFVIIVGALLALVSFFVRERKALGEKTCFGLIFQAVCMVFILIGIANIHNILPAGGTVAFRTVISYSLIVGILLFWSVQHIMKIVLPKRWSLVFFRGIVLVFMLGAGLLAQQNMLNHARNMNLEILYVRAKISEHLRQQGRLKEIHVIPVDYPRRKSDITYLGHPRSKDYEYLYNSFWDEWAAYVNAIFSDIKKERDLQVVCNAMHAPYSCREKQIRVFSYYRIKQISQVPQESPDILVIDMQNLMPLSSESPGVAGLLQK